MTKAIKGDMRAATQTLRLMEAYEDTPKQADEKGLTINVIDNFDDPE